MYTAVDDEYDDDDDDDDDVGNDDDGDDDDDAMTTTTTTTLARLWTGGPEILLTVLRPRFERNSKRRPRKRFVFHCYLFCCTRDPIPGNLCRRIHRLLRSTGHPAAMCRDRFCGTWWCATGVFFSLDRMNIS